MVLGVLFFGPEILRAYWPSVARFFPPFLLSSVLFSTVGYALLVWRPRQVLDRLFPGCALEVPQMTQRERTGANVSAFAGVAVSSVLCVVWLWGVL